MLLQYQKPNSYFCIGVSPSDLKWVIPTLPHAPNVKNKFSKVGLYCCYNLLVFFQVGKKLFEGKKHAHKFMHWRSS